ncbi:hypothetical protein VTO42DRAFT_7051 [Malbranchea cinnamomea]
MGMKILVAPTGFKESLEAHVAADCIEAGILRVIPDAEIRKVPLVDGGEGFARALVTANGGEHRCVEVTGPVNKKVLAYYGFIGGRDRPKTAIIDMAAAAGLRLVPKDMRDPTVTTTFGVGELIVAALREGAEQIVLGCGDSGTSDGGVGMCQALGARFLDHEGRELPLAGGGRTLTELAHIDLSTLHPCLSDVKIDVLCNWKNVLCGPKGVATVYGPQKGATAEQVRLLASAFDTYAAVVKRTIGIDVSLMPGSGASGGLGTGLILIGAKLRPRFEAITEYFGIEDMFRGCQLVFTAEGGIDYQTPLGKIPAEVAMRAKRHRIPVIALAGTIGKDASANYDVGIDAFASITPGPISLENAVKEAEQLLTDCAERALRTVRVGMLLQTTRREPTHGEKARELLLSTRKLVRKTPRGLYLGFVVFLLCCFHIFHRATLESYV